MRYWVIVLAFFKFWYQDIYSVIDRLRVYIMTERDFRENNWSTRKIKTRKFNSKMFLLESITLSIWSSIVSQTIWLTNIPEMSMAVAVHTKIHVSGIKRLNFLWGRIRNLFISCFSISKNCGFVMERLLNPSLWIKKSD
jgi:hypothetical protein